MKVVPRSKVIYSFSRRRKPVEYVKSGELVLLETEDALGGQVKDEKASMSKLDWSKVDGATGPLFVKNAEPGDTLIAEILDIRIKEQGVIVTVPKQGILGRKKFSASAKVVGIRRGYIDFERGVRVKVNPMIGTIGVSPGSALFTNSGPVAPSTLLQSSLFRGAFSSLTCPPKASSVSSKTSSPDLTYSTGLRRRLKL